LPVANLEPSQAISELLGSGERLLWAGRPGQGIRFRGSDSAAIPFGLFWTGFIVFWELNSMRSGNLFMQLWGIPFLLVGFHMLVGRFIVDSWQRSRTYYGLTNQRVIIFSKLLSRSVKSLNLRSLTDVSLSERANRTGTITFGPSVQQGSGTGFRLQGMNAGLQPSFEMIADARGVFDQIRRAQA
jgi:hypothetical protein